MSPPSPHKIGVFILAKDEEANIGRSLSALEPSGWQVCVLDSGSSDQTEALVSHFTFAKLRPYTYTNHADAYNYITSDLASNFEFAIVIDADMIIGRDLQAEISGMITHPAREWSALDANIEMFSNGVPLRYASLYPPKPFLFKTGRAFFVPSGHGEKIADDVVLSRVTSPLQHDDRKDFGRYLGSQFRYANKLVDNYDRGDVSRRDVMRIRSPLLMVLVPIFSFVFKRGFLDGRAGAIYALDRLIAEAIMYRQGLAHVDRKRDDAG